MLVIKKDQYEGHFTNYQLQMGLCEARFCDIMTRFCDTITMRIYFLKNVFFELIHKINSFYKKNLLPKLAIDFVM